MSTIVRAYVHPTVLRLATAEEADALVALR